VARAAKAPKIANAPMTQDHRYLVLSAVGPDRPGLVNEISALIREAPANLEDSRMAILGGEFAVILLISGARGALEHIENSRSALERKTGLTITLKQTARSEQRRNFLPYRIRVTGVDRPGIVHGITQVLAGRGVNVASLESRLAFAAESGTPMFVLEAELQVPSEMALSQLRRDLASACEEDNLDFTFESMG
jgi:glycine cleavage system transcriptional repressor